MITERSPKSGLKKVRFDDGFGLHTTAGETVLSAQAKYAPMPTAGDRPGTKGEYLRVSGSNRYRCLCGSCHVVLGTKLFLALYVCLSAVGFLGLVGTLVWTIIPIFVTGMALYACCRARYKYLYPFVLISVVHALVCAIMALVVPLFAAFNYGFLRALAGRLLNTDSNDASILVAASVLCVTTACIFMAFVHIWQASVVYSCIQFYAYSIFRDVTPSGTSNSLPTHGCPSMYESKSPRRETPTSSPRTGSSAVGNAVIRPDDVSWSPPPRGR